MGLRTKSVPRFMNETEDKTNIIVIKIEFFFVGCLLCLVIEDV